MSSCLPRAALAERARAAEPRFTLGVASSITRVPAQALDRLAQGRGVFVSRPFLLFMEKMREDQGAHYVTCTETATGRIVGVCPVYPGQASAHSYWSPNTHYLRRAVGRADDDAWTPGAFVGARSGYGWSFLMDPGLGEDEGVVLAAMLSAAAGTSGQDGAVAAMFLADTGRAQLCALGAQDDDLILAGATSVLDLRWSSFEDYLAELARPDNARRETRAFERSGATTQVVPLAQGMAAVAPLFTQLEDKYGGTSTPQAELVEMERLAEAMGPAAQLILALRDSQVVGAALFLDWEGTIYVRQAGFDYALTGHAFEYFNLVYYGIIRHAIGTGAARVDYGMATYRAKLARGAVVEPLWGLAIDRHERILARRPEVQVWDRTRRQAVQVGTAAALEGVELP